MNDLLLCHGALGAKDQFEALEALLSDTFRVHRINFSGHGGVPIPEEGFSMEHFALDILQYLNEQEIEQADIFGYSMGGYAALTLAVQHPDRIRRIATLGTKITWTPETAAHEQRYLQPSVMEEKIPDFVKILAERHAPVNWKKVVRHSAQMMLDLGNAPVLDQESFEQIQQPVSIGIGALDRMVSREECLQAVEWLPNGTLQVYEHFKHPIEQVDFAILAAYLKRFFST